MYNTEGEFGAWIFCFTSAFQINLVGSWKASLYSTSVFIAMTAIKLFKRRVLVLVLKNAISALWSFVPAEALEWEIEGNNSVSPFKELSWEGCASG